MSLTRRMLTLCSTLPLSQGAQPAAWQGQFRGVSLHTDKWRPCV